MYRGELFHAIGDTPGALADLKKAMEVSAADWSFRGRCAALLARLLKTD